MNFGHFDDENREYVITTPKTPLPWINYLGCKDFFSLISNTCGGYSFYKDAKLLRITRFRYNSVPADTNGKYYNAETGNYSVRKTFGDIRGEKHFFPDSEENMLGNDLWFEYSFLWNDTLQNLSKKNAAGEDNKLHQVLCGEMHSKAFFWMALKDGAKGAESVFFA